MTGIETGVILAWTAAAATVAGAAVSAAGAISAAQAREEQSEFQAEVAQQQATSQRQRSNIESERFLDRQRRLLSAQRARRAASGIALEGSPLLVEDETIDEIAFQTVNIRRGGEIRATRLEQEAALRRAQGEAAERAGFFRAGSTLLTTGAEFA